MFSPIDSVGLIATIPKRHHYQKRSKSALTFFEDEVDTLKHVKSTTYNVHHKKFEATQIDQRLESRKDSELCLPLDKEVVLNILDASTLNDFPARYQICNLEKHQFPAIGVYIDPKIVPGFKYRVLRLDRNGQKSSKDKYLFNGKSLTLLSIGRGYARRFAFENEKSSLEEENYFFSDNNSQGYAFELEAILPGDKFTIFNANHEAQGILEIIKSDKKQVEINSKCHNKMIEKRIDVKFTALVSFMKLGYLNKFVSVELPFPRRIKLTIRQKLQE